MTRRNLLRVFGLALVTTGVAGCDTFRPWHRQAEDDKAASSGVDDVTKPGSVRSDASKFSSVDSDSSDSKPFFSNSRRWSGLSSEARDIERNLGIN